MTSALRAWPEAHLTATGKGRNALYAALCALSDSRSWTSFGRRIEPIPVERVLSEAWDPDRLRWSQELLAEGRTAPPVVVMRYDLPDREWYGLSDGNHRTEAARAAGLASVAARVDGAYAIDLECYRLRLEVEGERLWRRGNAGSWDLVAEISDATAETLAAIGVHRHASPRSTADR